VKFLHGTQSWTGCTFCSNRSICSTRCQIVNGLPVSPRVCMVVEATRSLWNVLWTTLLSLSLSLSLSLFLPFSHVHTNERFWELSSGPHVF
jgi:hypothetical protein